jgi:glyoxylase-like metal-dependent hydrolase (beta-lactamase superfamily II)
MSIESNVWQPVPGMSTVEIYAIVTRPSITSSNCYVLRSSNAILVIDPGASTHQTQLLSELVRAELAVKSRPVLVVLSLCHQDHSQEAGNLALPPDTEVILCIEGTGADALMRGDRELTFCCYYPWHAKICSLRPSIRLFSGEAVGAVDTAGRVIHGADTLDAPGGRFAREWLQLSDTERIELHHTPGHSDCSITIKAGELLFLGDVPFAANPGLCGIYGWNHVELMRSIQNIEWLFDHSNVSICLPGHGFAQPTAAMRSNLRAMVEESAGLSNTGTLSTERVTLLKLHLSDVLEEASYLFTVISGQLYSLSFHLAELEEAQACQEVLAALDFDKVEQLLMDFRRFTRDFKAAETPDLTFVMKGVQVTSRLLKLLGGSSLDGLIDVSLSGRARRLLEDFLAMVRGLQFAGADGIGEINAIVRALLDRIAAGRADDLDSVPDEDIEDPVSFARILVRRLANRSLLESVRFDFDPTDAATTAMVGEERLDDILLCLIEGVAGSGVRHIRLQTLLRKRMVVLRLSSPQAIYDQGFGPRRLALYNRTLSSIGGDLKYQPGEGFEVSVPMARATA